MKRAMHIGWPVVGMVVASLLGVPAIAANETPVTLVQDGAPTMPILVDKALLPLEATTAKTPRNEAAEEAPQPGPEQSRAVRDKALPASRRTLAAVFKDLNEAALLVADKPEYRQRVDQMRMYACYLGLRLKVWEAAAAKNNAATIEAIKAETLFGGRLSDSNMIHSRALLGKGFERHFKPYASLLKGVPEAAELNKGFRRVGPEPTHEELDKLWAQWRASQAASQ